MRGILAETIIDFPAPDNRNVSAALAYTETFIRRWKNDSLITPGRRAAFDLHSLGRKSPRSGGAGAARGRAHLDPHRGGSF